MKLFSNHITQRFATAFLCIMLLTLMLFSCLLILVEHGHDCSGNECPICNLIDQAEATLTCLGTAEHIPNGWILLSKEHSVSRARPLQPASILITPVHLKVRQNK